MGKKISTIEQILVLGILLIFNTTARAVNHGCNLMNACEHMRYCAYTKLNWTDGGGPGALLRAMNGGDGNGAATLTGICQGLNGTGDSWIADGSCSGDELATMTHVALQNDCGRYAKPGTTPSAPLLCYNCLLYGDGSCSASQGGKNGTSCTCNGGSGYLNCTPP
jgi:hypothetical protein